MQASELLKCIHRAEEVKIYARKLHVQFTEAHAQAATAESRETTIAEALKEAKPPRPTVEERLPHHQT
jgi:hypothetical protein